MFVFSKLDSPCPLIPQSTLQPTPHDIACKTRGQMDSLFSFPVWLFHPYNMPVLILAHPSSTSKTGQPIFFKVRSRGRRTEGQYLETAVTPEKTKQ
jgi:hypothetical protein